MDDDGYRDLIRTYDLATLLDVRERLDVEAYPDRLTWIDEEIERRRRGNDPLPAPPPTALDFSREEIFAGFFWRLGALLVDLAIVYIPYRYAFEHFLQARWLIPIAVLPLVFPIYNIVFIAFSGQTPGKRIMGIVVRSADGGPAGGVRALKRHSPDLALGTAMTTALVAALVSGFAVPEVESPARLFHRQLPLWDDLDLLWTIWIWSELVLLALDERRRSLHEFLSGTLVLHASRRHELDLQRQFDPSWYDWLERHLGRTPSTSSPD